MIHTCINLCSGQRPFSGPFVNADINPKWKPDIVCDGAHMPMFDPGSTDIIVIHHGLEHFGLGEADQMLRECHRILKPGGSLICTVPDLNKLARAWIDFKLNNYGYMVNLYGAYMDDEADRHKWGFTQQSLEHTLAQAAGWFKVKQFDWRELPGANIAQDWWIAGAEAIK